jgi:hypothetical protein
MGSVPDFIRRAAQHLRVDSEHLHALIANARHQIFVLGRAIGSSTVHALLKAQSWVPVQVWIFFRFAFYFSQLLQNAFSTRIFPVDSLFNSFQMFAPDLMHELELGVWKAVFTQLVRLLDALPNGAALVLEMNRRFAWPQHTICCEH